MSTENNTALALDRSLISETIFRYHRAFDRKDWEGCRGSFTDSVEVETSGMAGSIAEVQSFPRDKMVRILQKMGAPEIASQHYSGNHIIEVAGDSAVCIASSMARSSKPQDGKQSVSFVGGWYTFSLVRTPQGWKIRKFCFEQAWSDSQPPDAIQDRAVK
jgi:hypothetical protein